MLRYTATLVTVFVCTLGAAGMPILYPIAAWSFFFGYVVDKYLLLRYFKTPFRYGPELAKATVGYLPIAAGQCRVLFFTCLPSERGWCRRVYTGQPVKKCAVSPPRPPPARRARHVVVARRDARQARRPRVDRAVRSSSYSDSHSRFAFRFVFVVGVVNVVVVGMSFSSLGRRAGGRAACLPRVQHYSP